MTAAIWGAGVRVGLRNQKVPSLSHAPPLSPWPLAVPVDLCGCRVLGIRASFVNVVLFEAVRTGLKKESSEM